MQWPAPPPPASVPPPLGPHPWSLCLGAFGFFVHNATYMYHGFSFHVLMNTIGGFIELFSLPFEKKKFSLFFSPQHSNANLRRLLLSALASYGTVLRTLRSPLALALPGSLRTGLHFRCARSAAAAHWALEESSDRCVCFELLYFPLFY